MTGTIYGPLTHCCKTHSHCAYLELSRFWPPIMNLPRHSLEWYLLVYRLTTIHFYTATRNYGNTFY